MRTILCMLLTTSLALTLFAWDGNQDNVPDKVRQIPPPGVKISDSDRAELTSSVADFEKEATSGQDPELKAFAVKYLPVLKQHLSMVEALQTK